MFSLSLGSIPLRIHFSFFIMAALLSATGGTDLRLTAIFIGVVFVSVLIHELGHAFAGMLFGLHPQIDLHGMGGTTSWTYRLQLSAAKRIFISLAGPMVGIVIGGALLLLDRAGLLAVKPAAAQVLSVVVFVNLYWGVLNLAPILPLDGGNVMAQVLAILTGGGGRKAAHIVSIVFAALGVLYGVLSHSYWLAFLAGMFAVQNFRALSPAQPPAAGPPAGAPRW